MSFIDPTNRFVIENSEQIYIKHAPSGKELYFKGYLSNFQDNFKSEWTKESVFGRNDPIPKFQSTTRVISIEWGIVASSAEEAKDNLLKISLLMAMTYPTYEDSSGNATTIKGSPILQIKYGNWISDANGPLTGFVEGFTYSPDIESGAFIENGNFYPKSLTMSCDFNVLHMKTIGWQGNQFRTAKFPYNIDINSKRLNTPSSAVFTSKEEKQAKAEERQRRAAGAILERQERQARVAEVRRLRAVETLESIIKG